MEKNNSTRSSMWGKIRQALAGYPTFRAVHRIKQYNRSEPKPVTITTHPCSPSPPPKHTAKDTAIRANPPLPQRVKVNTEGEGAIPIIFDWSTPSSSISKVPHQASKVASPHVGHSEREGKVTAKVEPEPLQHVAKQGKPPTKLEFVGFPAYKGTAPGPLKGKHGLAGMQHSEQQQGKKALDINDTFTEYIQRTKYQIRAAPNVGASQGNSAPDAANGYCC